MRDTSITEPMSDTLVVELEFRPEGWLKTATRHTTQLVVSSMRALTKPIGRASSDTSTSLLYVSSVLSNPLVSAKLRKHFQSQSGGESLEFLVAYSSFARARNSLQRFELFRGIFHRFVRDNAERPVALPEEIRGRLIREWVKCSDEGRVAVDTELPALSAAAIEVHKIVASQPTLARWLMDSTGR